jgi:hypothetical protein
VAKKIVIAGQRNLGSKVPSANIFESPNSTTAFDMATFSPKLNLAPSKPMYLDDKIKREYNMVTLEDLKYRSIEHAKEEDAVSGVLRINFDKKNLNNYAYFGSLRDLMTTSITNIINKWVGGLSIDMYSTDSSNIAIVRHTVYDYRYDRTENTSIFRIPAYVIDNKFGLIIDEKDRCIECGVRDININFSSYVLLFNNQEYPIVSFSGLSQTNSTDLHFKISGQPFMNNIVDNVVQAPFPVSFHIKPNEREYRTFLNGLSSFEKYLLGDGMTPTFTAIFKLPVEDENGSTEMVEESITWPTTDGYNIDVDTWQYEQYLKDLLHIGTIYDEFKTNLLINKLTPRVIFDLDMTEDKKMEKLIKIYGRKFDEVKAFVDGLVYINRIGYDKVETAPDMLIKNLANTLGWDVVNFTGENELFDTIFNTKTVHQNKNYTPAEIDIELWRRILMNTAYFFKTKGTRQAIEAIFAMIGVPDSIIEFNEHVYISDDKVVKLGSDYNDYPTAHYGMHFHNIDDEDNQRNLYIEEFKERGFNLQKVIDNQKTAIDKNMNLVNTKEVSISISSAKPLEYDVYKATATELSFIEYLDSLYSKYVSIRDNKLVYDHMTQSYPTLFEVLVEYYKVTNNRMTFQKIMKYATKFSGLWFKFISQFIPATTIITESGLSIRNTAFTPQKFKYRTTLDNGCILEKEQQPTMSAEMLLFTLDMVYSEGITNEETEPVVKQGATGEVMSSDSSLVTDEYSYLQSQTVYAPNMSGSLTVVKVPKLQTRDVVKIKDYTISGSTNIPFEKDVDSNKPILFHIDDITDVQIFGITLHEYKPAFGYFASKPVFTKEYLPSDIVGNSIRIVIPAKVLKDDTQYLVKPYLVLNANVSTQDKLFVQDSPYGIYRDATDFYFPSIGVPSRPFVYLKNINESKDLYTTATATESFLITDDLIVADRDEIKLTLTNEIRESDLEVRLDDALLVKGVDYTQSALSEKVIFVKNASKRQGTLSVLYVVDDSNDIIYNLVAGDNTIEWTLNEKINPTEKGFFAIEFGDNADASFAKILHTININYKYDTTYFTHLINTSIPVLESGKVYRVRVASNKKMETLSKDVVTSRVYSDFFKVRIP